MVVGASDGLIATRECGWGKLTELTAYTNPLLLYMALDYLKLERD